MPAQATNCRLKMLKGLPHLLTVPMPCVMVTRACRLMCDGCWQLLNAPSGQARAKQEKKAGESWLADAPRLLHIGAAWDVHEQA